MTASAGRIRLIELDISQVGSLDLAIFSEVVSLSSEGILIVDAQSPAAEIVYANSAYERASGYAAEELVGTSWMSYASAGEKVSDFLNLKRSLACNEAVSLSLPFLRKDGDVWLGRLKVTPLETGAAGQRLVLVAHQGLEVVANHGAKLLQRALGQARQKIASLDRTDPMTGLMSKSQFTLMLRRELAVARREQKQVHLILFSIPELDIYRATYGNNAADSCLRMIGAQVAGTFRRASDLRGRIDEVTFGVAIKGQELDFVNQLVGVVKKKARSLALHNPRGRLGGYVIVHGEAVTADRNCDDPESLIELGRIALEAGEAPTLAVADSA